MANEIDNLTKEDFEVTQDVFDWIKFYLNDKNIETREDALDYHTEMSEKDMFNWIYDGDDLSPWEIKHATLPSEDRRCAEINGMWYFWYSAI